MSYPTEHPPVPPQNGPLQQGSGFPTGQQGYSAEGMNAPAASPTRKKLALIISGVVGLAVIAAGIAFGMNFFRSTASPADGLPGSANMVIQVELNPNDAKKLEIYQLLSKFPTVKEKLNQDSFTADPLKAVWESLVGPSTRIDYDADIKSWLGDSLGVAVVVQDGTPKPVISIHAKDAKKAKDFFDNKFKEVAGGTGNLTATVSGSFVVLTASEDAALVDEVKNNPLSKSSTYSQDMAHLADRGLASIWADEKFFKAVASTSGVTLPAPAFEGRIAASLSVSSSSIQFNSWGTSSEAIADGDVRDLVAGLPARSDLVVAGSPNGKSIESFGKALKSSMKSSYSDLEEILGGDVEAALSTMLGSQIAFTAEVESLSGASKRPYSAAVALVTKSDDTSKQESFWKSFSKSSRLPVQFEAKDGVSATSLNPAYTSGILRAKEKLGDKDSFKATVDTSKPTVALVYYDPKATIETFRSSLPEQYIGDLEAISGIGLTFTKADANSVNAVLKVAVKS